MYTNRSYSPKSYSSSKHDLASLPLADFSEKYESIKANIFASYAQIKASAQLRAEKAFLAKYARENEGSFEGSLEGVVEAQLPNLPDLGSDPDIVELFTKFSRDWSIPKNADWFFSQTLSRFAQLPLVKNDNGYSAKALVLDHIKKSPELNALWLICRYPKRSLFLDKQTDPRFKNYSSLVPIIMSAFKKLNGISYSEWDREEVNGLVDANLAKAMLLEEPLDVSADEILHFRTLALTPRSGANAGITRSAVTTYTLYPTADSPLFALPALARIMYCQTWCAHPQNRTEFMVLNPFSWDETPPPLISSEIFSSPKNPVHTDLGANRWDI